MVIANSVTNEFVEALPDCYDAVEEKGGTLPAEQTAANLPDAIESIPSGGTYGFLESIGVNSSDITEANDCVDKDVELSKENIDISYKPYVYVDNIGNNFMYNKPEKKTTEIVVANTFTDTNPYYQAFFNQYGLRTLIVGGGRFIAAWQNNYYTFHNCYCLRNVFMILDCDTNTTGVVSGFSGVQCLREIRIKSAKTSFNVSNWTSLSHTSLVYMINNLQTVEQTLTLGSANQAKLTVEEIAVATDKGWTIA
jgi:hypothetical protein